MIPIHSLLARIQWDREFGQGSFVIGYYDRVKRVIVKVPLAQLQLQPGNHFSFTAIESDGSVHDVPFHRVREVYREGVLIWHRPEVKYP